MATVISADEIKKSKHKSVILLNGGTASGKRASVAFLSRDRKSSDSHFYKTHSGSRKTLLWIAKNYPQIKINIVESYEGNPFLILVNVILEFNFQIIVNYQDFRIKS